METINNRPARKGHVLAAIFLASTAISFMACAQNEDPTVDLSYTEDFSGTDPGWVAMAGSDAKGAFKASFNTDYAGQLGMRAKPDDAMYGTYPGLYSYLNPADDGSSHCADTAWKLGIDVSFPGGFPSSSTDAEKAGAIVLFNVKSASTFDILELYGDKTYSVRSYVNNAESPYDGYSPVIRGACPGLIVDGSANRLEIAQGSKSLGLSLNGASITAPPNWSRPHATLAFSIGIVYGSNVPATRDGETWGPLVLWDNLSIAEFAE